ncbi:hypothetical protein [Lachnoclostridium sp. An181]|uniref:hypothetical protein n=1 Tax=Lachnoclostridium sp. An181 TaxID=1965575 RepID=UPI00194FA235|nr:hypothetical protein [Lachnoclostridium sp. An181]
MKRKLIIDGNAVFELDEECMLKKQLDAEKNMEDTKRETRNLKEWKETYYNHRR